MSGGSPAAGTDGPQDTLRPDRRSRELRRELVRRQLEVHLPLPPATVLEVLPRTGSLSPALAAEGYEVVVLAEPGAPRDALAQALAAEPPDVARRVGLVEGDVATLDALPDLRGRTFDVVLAHDLLPRVPHPQEPLRALGRRVAVDGILSLVALNAVALAWAPAQRGDVAAATAALDAVRLDALGGTRGTAGASTTRLDLSSTPPDLHGRGDTLEHLGAYLGGIRCALELWYGVGTVTPAWRDDDPRWGRTEAEALAVTALEERLARTEPYRRNGALLHLVGRRGEGRGPVL